MASDLNVEGLRFRYRTGAPTWLFEMPRLVIQERAAVSLLGDNMSGKTSFLKLLAGTVDRAAIEVQGHLTWQERRFAVPPPASAMRDLGLATVNQNDAMFPELSTIENIVISSPAGFGRTQAVSRAKAVLHRFEQLYEAQDIGAARLGALSGGGRGLVRLLRALAWPHQLLFMDEPTANLDEQNRLRVFQVLHEFLDQSATVVLVSHLPSDHEQLATLAQMRQMNRSTLRISDARAK